MDPAPATLCTACGAQVALEEVAQGLAVKVSGRLLCPLCVDHLPADAKVAVNQMRALRGMAVTTYRYHSGRHPGLPLFTFTTSALVLNHRRKLVHGEDFDAPLLPPPGSRPRLPTASEAARGDRHGWIAVAGITILIITGIVWLAVPASPPPPTPSEPPPAAVPAPVRTPPTAIEPAKAPETNYASLLTDLERRLAATPDAAASIADEAELLRDAIPPRERGLRTRAEELARAARQRIPAPVPPSQPEPTPEPRQPEPKPEPLVAVQPPTPVLQPQPPVAQPEPPVAKPEPAPAPQAPVNPAPKPAKTGGAVRWDPRVLPPGATPLLSAERPSPGKQLLPWPWPSGDPIWAGSEDRKRKRLAIELGFTMVGESGGVALVVHPHRADRTSLIATWSDATRSAPSLTLPLESGRWQTVLIPGTGIAGLDAAQLRLRLEDSKELPSDRPFLIAGAAMRSDSAPRAEDCPPRLPLLDPATLVAANGKPMRDADLLALIRKVAAEPLKDRQFSISNVKVLISEVEEGRNAEFRSTMRRLLATLQADVRRNAPGLANGNPADLPKREPPLLDAKLGWPKGALSDLEDYDAVALGWGTEGYDDPAQLTPVVESLFSKFLTPQTKPRRKAVLPILLLGSVERIKADEQAAIDARWLTIAPSLLTRGIPVIDLRPAQREATAELVREAAAQLLVDGLRQLDWLLRR